jgi:hypothetical protein
MSASSEEYASVRAVFQAHAAEQADDLLLIVEQMAHAVSVVGELVAKTGADAVCRLAATAGLRAVSLLPANSPAAVPTWAALAHSADLWSDASPAKILALCDAFFEQHGRFPSPADAPAGASEQSLSALRACGVQQPSLAAVLGGVAAQEMIKLATRCYMPLEEAFELDIKV